MNRTRSLAVAMAILIALAWYLGGSWPIEGAAGVLGYLVMAFLPEPLGVPLLNDVWWTLPIEFSFYLALPLLGALLHRRWIWPLFISPSTIGSATCDDTAKKMPCTGCPASPASPPTAVTGTSDGTPTPRPAGPNHPCLCDRQPRRVAAGTSPV